MNKVFHGILVGLLIELAVCFAIYACSLEIHQTKPVTPNQCMGGTGGITHR